MATPQDLLARIPLFSSLGAEDLAHVAAIARVRRLDKGERVFELGEPGRSLFLITEGFVQIHQPHRETHFELAQLGPGDFFGEMALLNDAPRSATAQAIEPAEVLVLEKADFHALIVEKPGVAPKLLEAMADRIRHADELINGLTNNAVRDPLTGLLNRTAFNDALGQEIARTRRYGGSFSLIILDFNNFTQVNRQVGREAGDEIIQWMGRLLTEHTRASDVPYRLEQDVFTILCPWTSGDYAEAVAGRLTVLVGEAKPPTTVEGGLSLATGTGHLPRRRSGSPSPLPGCRTGARAFEDRGRLTVNRTRSSASRGH